VGFITTDDTESRKPPTFPHERQQFITAIKTTNQQSKKEHR
jgi:hypothetical protein